MKFLTLSLLAAMALPAQVSNDRLLHPDREPQNWLTYSGSYSSQRYSLLDQITPENVKNLEVQWVFQARSLEKFETTPLVVDGVMYIVRGAQSCVRAGRQNRTRVLGLRLSPFARRAAVLRLGESRRGHPGRHAVHGNHRRAPAGASMRNRAGRCGRPRSPIPSSATPSRMRR